jgi:hypothetical protein
MVTFLEIEKLIFKFMKNLKRPQTANAILINADLKLYYRAIVTKTA